MKVLAKSNFLNFLALGFMCLVATISAQEVQQVFVKFKSPSWLDPEYVTFFVSGQRTIAEGKAQLAHRLTPIIENLIIEKYDPKWTRNLQAVRKLLQKLMDKHPEMGPIDPKSYTSYKSITAAREELNRTKPSAQTLLEEQLQISKNDPKKLEAAKQFEMLLEQAKAGTLHFEITHKGEKVPDEATLASISVDPATESRELDITIPELPQ